MKPTFTPPPTIQEEDQQISEEEEIHFVECVQCFPRDQQQKNGKIRWKLHLLIYHPESSIYALGIQAIVILITLLSAIQVILSSLENLNYVNDVWDIIEILVTVVLTAEFVMRFISMRNFKLFCKSLPNWIDFISSLPFYVLLIIGAPNSSATDLVIIRTFRIFKVLRLLKLFKYLTFLKVFYKTLKDSSEALILLLCFIVIISIIFGSLINAAEQGEWSEESQTYVRSDGNPSPFRSIPMGIYWAITAITSVGYGDVNPIESWGLFISSLAMITGIMMFALPLAVISSNFQIAFAEYKSSKVKRRRKKKITKNDKVKAEFKNVIHKYDKLVEDMNKLIAILHHQCSLSLISDENKSSTAFLKKKQKIVDNAFKSVAAHTDSNIQTMKASVWGILDNADKLSQLIQICKENWEIYETRNLDLRRWSRQTQKQTTTENKITSIQVTPSIEMLPTATPQ